MKMLRKRIVLNLIGNAYQQRVVSQEISHLLDIYQNIKAREIYISENKFNIMYNLQLSKVYDENISILINSVIPHRYSPPYLRLLNNNIRFYSDHYFYPYCVKLTNNPNKLHDFIYVDSEIDSTYTIGKSNISIIKRLYSLCSHLN